MNVDNNQEILESPLRPDSPYGFWEPHHLRHLVSGCIVFTAGVIVTEVIAHLRDHRPQTVRWQTGELQTNYARPRNVPGTMPFSFEIGVSDDGRIVWREKK